MVLCAIQYVFVVDFIYFSVYLFTQTLIYPFPASP